MKATKELHDIGRSLWLDNITRDLLNSADGTWRSPKRYRPSSSTASASRSPAERTKAYRELLDSPRWQRAFNLGVLAQRLLWASTGTRDPKASDILYVKALAAPLTVNTLPEGTLKTFGDHGEVGELLPIDGGDSERVLAAFAAAGIDVGVLADRLQDEGAKAFVRSWQELLARCESKSSATDRAG